MVNTPLVNPAKSLVKKINKAQSLTKRKRKLLKVIEKIVLKLSFCYDAVMVFAG
jgi:hypothetical protein